MALKKKRVRTPEQIKKHNEASLAWRHRMVALGLCTQCGKEKAVEGHRLCEACREKSKKKLREQTNRARIMGKCVRCRKNWALPHMRICLPCKMWAAQWQEDHAEMYTYAARKDYLKKKRDRYRAEGRCIMCGRPTDGSHTRCDMCRERQSAADKRRRERKKMDAFR